ncbi:hypothetical protein JCM16161A_24010 [Vulcanisaeta sp. JCM 16161]|uniref:hypothetical protein n=1 Tax=Vulcanisaeta sp. JCM 16161 TaxID=1295372 RepID=UPI0006D0278A|nr:hypothetical protein [Vulcanisaeta sp. JCM 16161]
MRLYQLGILLIILAILIPIIAVVMAIAAGVSSSYTAPSNVGGAIVIFPIVPIPILITFGKPQITQPLIWFTYVIFLIFLALVIFSIVQYYRARRELMRRWQEEHK